MKVASGVGIVLGTVRFGGLFLLVIIMLFLIIGGFEETLEDDFKRVRNKGGGFISEGAGVLLELKKGFFAVISA